jgi:hypothetical protein
VIVTDAGGAPVQGVPVTFAVASGGGSITGASASTDVNGLAAPASWTLGPAPGKNTLTATSTGLSGSPVTLTATGTGPATNIAVFVGNGQSAPVLFQVAQVPCVIVTDAGGTGVAGVSCTFTVTSGGGSIVGPNVGTTDSLGIAFINGWIMGPLPGPNTLDVTAAGLIGSPVTFTDTGTAPIAINSGPVASDTQPDAGEIVTFTTGANLAGSTFNWDFGDGTSDTSGNASVQHSFAAAGSYTVTATASNGTQNKSGVVNIVVYAPQPMTITKKSIKAANPSKSKDSAQFSGTLTFPAGTSSLPSTVIVRFGSFTQSFGLVKGSGKSGASQFKLSGKQRNGVLSSPLAGLKIKLGGNLLGVLSNTGLALGKNGSVSIPLRLTFFGTPNSANVELNFAITGTSKSERGM